METNIIGTGSTKFGEHWQYGLRDMISYASKEAIESARIKLKDVDSAFVANCFGSAINEQNNIDALCSDELGIENITVIGGGDDSGTKAIIQAAESIASGLSKVALVIGAEKISDLPSAKLVRIISQLTDRDYEASVGATLESLYAMMALRHMEMHGTTEKQLAMVSVKNHLNAMNNEIAQFRFKISVENVLESSWVAKPLRMLNSFAPCDGCSAVVLSNDNIAKSSKKKIGLVGSGTGSDSLLLSERKDIASFKAVKNASDNALKYAGVKLEEISFAEVQDTFSIAEIMAIEDIGFARKGEGGKFIEKGMADLKGKVPINPSGGLKGCGHPFAATGVRQAAEAFYQLTGSAGERQVKNVKYALAQTLSGTGATAAVNIFKKIN